MDPLPGTSASLPGQLAIPHSPRFCRVGAIRSAVFLSWLGGGLTGHSIALLAALAALGAQHSGGRPYCLRQASS